MQSRRIKAVLSAADGSLRQAHADFIRLQVYAFKISHYTKNGVQTKTAVQGLYLQAAPCLLSSNKKQLFKSYKEDIQVLR